MKNLSTIIFFLLSANITFSQTTLNLDMNDLQDEHIICMVNVLLNIDEEISHYKYLIENDTINDIVHLNRNKWRTLPINGKITGEDFCVSYFLKHEKYKSEGIISGKLIIDKDNYFRFKIKDEKVILEKVDSNI